MINLGDLIKRAVVSLVGTDDKQFRIQQAKSFGDAYDVEIIFPYGVTANLPLGAFLTQFSVDGDEGFRVAIGDDPGNRIKNLAAGEVAFFHPPSKSKIHFKANGDIDIETPDTADNGDLNLTIKGNVNITCVNANITATTKLTVDSPEAQFTGNVDIDGDLNVDGSTSLSSTVTSSGTDISNTHKHSGVQSGGSNTGNPI